ncbi:DNA-directed RNA polymerase subunit delta [Ureaplasma miroungigenitalium]|uniref:DNA-directed RNA polymerase subunit delta n=1 Tax=Ureaplasma miroungigenitalium TaxID=1042321 RepID=A0ABT3BNB1_9BACT|nr:DNA-directed RNA polymerase subunit delta [Ureaplasma miroungigenitalium]MCV3728718.1 DNA-directed RNA polymerase subunit delta [Ureaplasma miroungigenitalium]MCV3734482.1 DNA-directed RNA polymerase subunit delta [Ureaplasma miroungigenitalium]
MNKKYIDIAYEAIVNDKEIQKQKCSFNFDFIVHKIVDNSDLQTDEMVQHYGELYSAILQDPRFILIAEKEWNLREHLSLKEITKIANAMYEVGSYKDNDVDDSEDVKLAKINKEKEEMEEEEIALSDFEYDTEDDENLKIVSSDENDVADDDLEDDE